MSFFTSSKNITFLVIIYLPEGTFIQNAINIIHSKLLRKEQVKMY